MNKLKKTLPTPIIKSRPVNQDAKELLLNQGLDSLLADILSRRLEKPIPKEQIFELSFSKLQDPAAIPSMDIAVSRIAKAIQNKEKIVFACDHDMDGTASAAVLWQSFVQYFGVSEALLDVVTSHRLTEGYGITEPVVQRILKINPTLVITADKGSSDEERIAKLAEAGIDVIVTDHHELGLDGIPTSALAVINPLREGSSYDSNICGAAVAFLSMAKVRTYLLEKGLRQSIPSLIGLLDLVAVATVADCVSLRPSKSYANRLFISKGLDLINKQERSCWKAFVDSIHGPVNAETIGYRLAPAIAAAGRLDWADVGFKFLIADSVEEASQHWQFLQSENETRKKIERRLRESAYAKVDESFTHSIVVYLEDGHSGVHGIVASRLVESYGKPAAVFSPKLSELSNSDGEDDKSETDRLATGSFRGVPGMHVRDALESVARHSPGLLISYGGHQGAAGASVKVIDIPRFAERYDQVVCEQLEHSQLQPTIWVDGELSSSQLNFDTLDKLESLEPWGRGFSAPIFVGTFIIENLRPVGDGSHIKLLLSMDEVMVDAMWFNVPSADRDNWRLGDRINLAYKMQSNWFRGNRKLQLLVESIAGT